eukprot:3692906-Prymnesium_polylepis.1
MGASGARCASSVISLVMASVVALLTLPNSVISMKRKSPARERNLNGYSSRLCCPVGLGDLFPTFQEKSASSRSKEEVAHFPEIYQSNPP